MIKTKLILVEGVPCSGKSTTATTMTSEISTFGYECHCYLEWEDNNPIEIGKVEDLAEIISTTKLREQNILQQWRNFAKRAKQQETINVIESRFWQSDAMYLYLSGHSEHEVFESNRRLLEVIAELDPVLVYLAPQEIERLQTRVAKKRNEKWRESGRDESWEEWGDRVYERQKWFTDRSLDSKSMGRFFNEWASIADKLYERFPFRKIRIQDPHIDWENTNGSIRDFLDVGSQ